MLILTTDSDYFKYLKERVHDAFKQYKRTIIYIIGGFVTLIALGNLMTYLYKLIGITATSENSNRYSDCFILFTIRVDSCCW